MQQPEKVLVEAHPSVAIVYCATNPLNLLMAVYDEGYRGGKGPYPLAANLIGGNPDIKHNDKSPLEVLVREVEEEFDPNFQKQHPHTNQFNQEVVWAHPNDIGFIQRHILGNLAPLQDFYVQAQEFGLGTASYSAIYSAFLSGISKHAFDIARSNLANGKTLTTEGLSGIFSLVQLEQDPREEFATAHATAPIINYFLNSGIPYPEQIQATPIGEPRNTFQEYLRDFEYSRQVKPNHNNPQKLDPSFHETVFGKQE